MPERYRALVGLAGGTGMRWGECIGLRWDAVDLDTAQVQVIRVAVEVNGNVSTRPYPKSKRSRRTIPLPPFVVQLLRAHVRRFPASELGDVFTNSAGGPLHRSLFRRRIWRPALVRAGLLGKVGELGTGEYLAVWQDAEGREHTATVPTEAEAVEHVARRAAGGLRFHDLRHSYATWLVSNRVPINDAQRVMGHEQAATLLDLYTHASEDQDQRIRNVDASSVLPPELEDEAGGDDVGPDTPPDLH